MELSSFRKHAYSSNWGLARYAAEFDSESDIRRLEAILNANKRVIRDAVEFNKTDIEVHRASAAALLSQRVATQAADRSVG